MMPRTATRRSSFIGFCQPDSMNAWTSASVPLSALEAASRTPWPVELSIFRMVKRSSSAEARSSVLARKLVMSASEPSRAFSAASLVAVPPSSQASTTRPLASAGSGTGPASAGSAWAIVVPAMVAASASAVSAETLARRRRRCEAPAPDVV